MNAEKRRGTLFFPWPICVPSSPEGEDRLHGRKIAAGLSGIRNAVLNLLRRLIGASSIPEARRKVAAMPDYGLHLLFTPLLGL
jgi:hypothetical protein